MLLKETLHLHDILCLLEYTAKNFAVSEGTVCGQQNVATLVENVFSVHGISHVVPHL